MKAPGVLSCSGGLHGEDAVCGRPCAGPNGEGGEGDSARPSSASSMSSSPSPDSSRARFTQGERLARRDASAGLRAALASSSLSFSRDDSRSHSIRWHSTCRSRTSSEVAAGFDEASAADAFRLTEGRSSSSSHASWSSSRSCFAPRALVLARTARSYLAARVDAPPRCARFFLAPTHANMPTAPRGSAARRPPFVTPGQPRIWDRMPRSTGRKRGKHVGPKQT